MFTLNVSSKILYQSTGFNKPAFKKRFWYGLAKTCKQIQPTSNFNNDL